jgi:hypothetical protein
MLLREEFNSREEANMKFELKGLYKFKRKLDDLERRAKEVEGEHDVPFEELFPPEFMRQHTDFISIDEMIKSSGFKVNNREDFKNIPDADWDSYVAKRTRFENWKDMMGLAAKEYYKKKLDL